MNQGEPDENVILALNDFNQNYVLCCQKVEITYIGWAHFLFCDNKCVKFMLIQFKLSCLSPCSLAVKSNPHLKEVKKKEKKTFELILHFVLSICIMSL